MIDLIRVQEDLFGLLMSAPQLATVNIVQERKFITQHEVELDTIWQTVRNNCSGDGLLIEAPDIICDSDAVSGPPQQVELSFVSFQNGDGAFNPPDANGLGGGGLFAEQIEQFLVDALHLQAISGIGTLRVVGRFSAPARDYPGINARRTKIICTPKQTGQTPRTATIQISQAGGLVTLTCATPGAQIYYTLDGSFPSNPAVAVWPLSVIASQPGGQPVNAGSLPYTAPVAVTTGQNLRAAAYAPSFNPGQIINYTAL